MSQCAFCRSNVSPGIERCPSCGAWLSQTDARLKQPEVKQPEPLPERVRALLAAGRKIEAIKIYREQTGVGLAEAKDAVEKLERGEAVDSGNPVASDFDQQLLELIAKGKKIPAIKLYRERTNVGLKEAKDAVEALGIRHGIRPTAATGCGAGVLLLLKLGALLFAAWYAMR